MAVTSTEKTTKFFVVMKQQGSSDRDFRSFSNRD